MSRFRSSSNKARLIIHQALQQPQPQPQPQGSLGHGRNNYTTTTSVDPTEISHFNGLASTWWDLHGPSRLLHLMNPLRHDFIQSCLSNTYTPHHQVGGGGGQRGLRYLDVGCGGGIFAESAARLRHTSQVIGLDPSGDVLDVARQHARKDPLFQQQQHQQRDDGQQRQKLVYLQMAVEEYPRPKDVTEQFDVVTLFEVIEHVNHPAGFLEACLPLVKPGGWLVLSTIARTWVSWFTTKIVAEDLVRLVPRGTHDWKKYVNEEELREWFARRDGWGRSRSMGVAYVPGFGWKGVPRGERLGNYFFGVRKNDRE